MDRPCAATCRQFFEGDVRVSAQVGPINETAEVIVCTVPRRLIVSWYILTSDFAGGDFSNQLLLLLIQVGHLVECALEF